MNSDRRELRYWIGACALAAVHLIAVAVRRSKASGDFDVSREFGRRFLAGDDLYAGGLHYPYLPSAAMLFSPLAMLPSWLGFGLRYAVALGCLWLSVCLCNALVATNGADSRSVDSGRPFWASRSAALALLLAAHYIVRDLDDSGPHLILLATLLGGLYFAARNQSFGAAVCFGLATAAKVPSLLVVPFLLVRGQRRLATWTVGLTLVWLVAPAMWTDAGYWWAQHVQWFSNVTGAISGFERSEGAARSEDRIQNQSLRATVARQVDRCRGMQVEGETICPPSVPARVVATAVSLLLVAVVAWRLNRQALRSGADWHREGSILLLLMLLLSPITWVQHLVLVYPALSFLAGADTSHGRIWIRRSGLAAFAVLALLLNRELIGRENYFALLAAGGHTAALLILLALLLTERATTPPSLPGAPRSPSSSDPSPRERAGR